MLNNLPLHVAGKVLTDTMSLKTLQIGHGSKVMLVATQGLHQGVISISCYLMLIYDTQY